MLLFLLLSLLLTINVNLFGASSDDDGWFFVDDEANAGTAAAEQSSKRMIAVQAALAQILEQNKDLKLRQQISNQHHVTFILEPKSASGRTVEFLFNRGTGEIKKIS